MKAELGKRALNKAQTRQEILQAVYRLSQDINFRDIKVKSIIADIGITEMTFFNYFPKKEDILKYMMGLWALDLLVLQLKTPLSGEAAIRRVFQHSAQQVKQHPRLMTSFIAALVTNEIDPSANDIEAADRYLLYPEFPEIQNMSIPSGNELLLQHLGELTSTTDPAVTLMHLASCFYGDILVAHTAGLNLNTLYDNSLNLIFKR